MKQAIHIQLIDKSLLDNLDFRRSAVPSLSAAQVQQLLMMYTPSEDSFEVAYKKTAPMPNLHSLSDSQEERLLLDASVILPFSVDDLHYLELDDLEQIIYSSPALVTALMKVFISKKADKLHPSKPEETSPTKKGTFRPRGLTDGAASLGRTRSSSSGVSVEPPKKVNKFVQFFKPSS